MRKRIILGFMVCLIICLNTIGISRINVVALEGVAVRVIIGLKDNAGADLVKAYSGTIKYEYTIIPAIASIFPQRCIEALSTDPRVAYVHLDGIVNILEKEDQLPWGVDRVDSDKVWGGSDGAVDVTRNGGAGIRVAIIDTGADYTHLDLASRFDRTLLGHDFVNNDADPMDDNGHGTHCAGIVAADDNERGLIGNAPQVKLYALKALDSKGSGYESDIVAAIEWCLNHDVDIISMSFGSSTSMPNLRTACDEAYSHGMLLVAAAGNSGKSRSSTDKVSYPAKYDSVIAVGATDATNLRATWSSTGSTLELVAPGNKINSTLLGNTYSVQSGTSMACPHVAGVAALVWAAHPSWTNLQVRQRLQATATDLGTRGKDSEYGYGLVNAYSAVTVTPPTPNTPPVANPGGPYSGIEDKTITFDASRSSDPDGDLLIYKWDFGDGTTDLVNTASTTHMYSTGEPGVTKIYVVTLTVNDGNVYSNSVSTRVTITGVNDLPIANLGGPYQGVVNKSLTFDASKSSDEEGLVSYTWNFGDGIQTKSTTPTITHVYMTTGSYEVTLTVTDTSGINAIAKTTATVTDKPIPSTATIVIDLSRSETQRGSWTISQVTVVVKLVDEFYGLPIENATVYGHWSGAMTGAVTGKTDARGILSATIMKVTNQPSVGTFTFTVDKVVKDGRALSLAGERSDSI